MFGFVLVAATVFDLLTSASFRRLTLRSTTLSPALAERVTNDDDDDDDDLITDQQSPVFGTADDVPLVLNLPSQRPVCRRVYGSSFILFKYNNNNNNNNTKIYNAHIVKH